jgi:hypothetical protein
MESNTMTFWLRTTPSVMYTVTGDENTLQLLMNVLFNDNDYVFSFEKTQSFKNVSPPE